MKSESIIMEQLKLFQEMGKTSLTVHHDLNTVEKYFDYVLFVNKTNLVLGRVEDTFTKEHIEQAYLNQPQSNSSENISKMQDASPFKVGEEHV